MRPLPTFRHWTAMLAVPLALWSALPTVRWCPASRDVARTTCLVPCVVGTECPAAETCSVETSCGAMAECAAGEPDAPDASDTLPSACEEGATFPCGLAFCVDGPTGGDAVPNGARAPLPDPPSVALAVLIAALDALEAPAQGGWTLDTADDFPASATRASSHHARAPPAFV